MGELAETCERLGIFTMDQDVFDAFHAGVVFRVNEERDLASRSIAWWDRGPGAQPLDS